MNFINQVIISSWNSQQKCLRNSNLMLQQWRKWDYPAVVMMVKNYEWENVNNYTTFGYFYTYWLFQKPFSITAFPINIQHGRSAIIQRKFPSFLVFWTRTPKTALLLKHFKNPSNINLILSEISKFLQRFLEQTNRNRRQHITMNRTKSQYFESIWIWFLSFAHKYPYLGIDVKIIVNGC